MEKILEGKRLQRKKKSGSKGRESHVGKGGGGPHNGDTQTEQCARAIQKIPPSGEKGVQREREPLAGRRVLEQGNHP